MNKCYECETIEDLQEHHVVPRSRGGTKTVTLCYECHMKVHGRDNKGLNHKKLVSEGLAKAKKSGVRLGTHNEKVMAGRKRQGSATVERVFPYIKEAQQQGITSQRKIAAYLNEKEILSPRGGKWTQPSIRLVLQRMNA